MDILLTLIALPLSWFGLSRLNQGGGLSPLRRTRVISAITLVVAMGCWIQTMGSLRGMFSFLGLLTLVGLAIAWQGTKQG